GNSIYGVEIIERGRDYTFANASVVTNPNIVPSTPAELVVVIPPTGGHGSNPATELVGTRVGISTTFANSENGRITTTNDYRSVSILHNPKFSGVNIEYTQINDDDIVPLLSA